MAIYIALLALGATIGSGAGWVASYYPAKPYVPDRVKLEDILRHSNTIIRYENYSCEGEAKETVGSVIGSIIELNNLNKRNMLSFGCHENICSISVTNCMPWQTQECGNRVLKFEINDLNKIQVNTFSCIDIP